LSIKKIAVIGPESTGKSTLSEALAKALNTVWVPEFARAYLENIKRSYEENDLLEIAKGQLKSENEMLEKANRFLICDTDLYVLKVWSEHKYNRCHRMILETIAQRHYDLYLLTDIDTQWEYDPLREHPDEAMRKYFHKQFQDLVVNSHTPFIFVSGNQEERLLKSLNAIKKLN
jgi:NadR type nicotinamide-nucleotide adenylyltransferase